MRIKTFLLGLLAAIVSIPIGYAIAQTSSAEGDESATVVEGGEDPEPQGDVPGVNDGFVVGDTTIPADEIKEDTWIIDEGFTEPENVEGCRSGEYPPEQCGLVLAVANGDVKPDVYTQSELESRVREAGYKWEAGE